MLSNENHLSTLADDSLEQLKLKLSEAQRKRLSNHPHLVLITGTLYSLAEMQQTLTSTQFDQLLKYCTSYSAQKSLLKPWPCMGQRNKKSSQQSQPHAQDTPQPITNWRKNEQLTKAEPLKKRIQLSILLQLEKIIPIKRLTQYMFLKAFNHPQPERILMLLHHLDTLGYKITETRYHNLLAVKDFHALAPMFYLIAQNMKTFESLSGIYAKIIKHKQPKQCAFIMEMIQQGISDNTQRVALLNRALDAPNPSLITEKVTRSVKILSSDCRTFALKQIFDRADRNQWKKPSREKTKPTVKKPLVPKFNTQNTRLTQPLSTIISPKRRVDAIQKENTEETDIVTKRLKR